LLIEKLAQVHDSHNHYRGLINKAKLDPSPKVLTVKEPKSKYSIQCSLTSLMLFSWIWNASY